MNNSSPMADLKLLLLEQWVTLWRHKWIAIGTCWVVCLLGWTGVMMIPRHYESDARAFVDVNGLLTPLLKGLVVDNNANQTSDYVRQTLLSRPNLQEVLHLAQLDIGKYATEREVLIAGLANNVDVRAQAKNLFTISYTANNPQVAKNVVDSLMTIFAEKAASSNRVEMEKAHKFLDDQIASYEEQLRGAEQRRADFRKKYADNLADPISGTPKLQALQQQMAAARRNYNQALITRDTLEAELKQIPQFRTVSASGSQTVGADGRIVGNSPAAGRLAQAKANLTMLRLKFTDQHPDVKAAINEVAELQSEVDAASAASAASAAPAAPTQSADGMTQVPNPTYDQIRLKLVELQTTIPPAKQALDEAVSEYEKSKVMSADIPDIDVKAKDLDRDYEVIKKNHEELIARRESANLSQAADDQADRTQFRIVDPPQLPLTPSFPNYPIMFSVVLILSLGAGGCLPIGIELVRSTFSSAGRLRGLGLPVIGAVTFVKRPGGTRRSIAGMAGVLVTGGALLVVYGALMVIGSGVYRGIL